jgi:hypothetical protein
MLTKHLIVANLTTDAYQSVYLAKNSFVYIKKYPA